MIIYFLDVESETRANTVWVVLGDIEPSVATSTHSLQLLSQAAKFMRRHATMDTRLGFVLNPSTRPSTTGSSNWGGPGWLSRSLLLIGHPAEKMLASASGGDTPNEKYMNIMAAKNFIIKITEEALKIVRGDIKEASPLSELSVSVSYFLFGNGDLIILLWYLIITRCGGRILEVIIKNVFDYHSVDTVEGLKHISHL